jgi:AraC family transcriptional regulator
MWPRLRSGAFYGQTLRSYRTGELALAECSYPPQFEAPRHAHERAYCYLMLKGSCTETCGGPIRTIAAPALVLLPAGEVHSNRWPAGGGCFHVEFSLRWLQRVREHSPVLDRAAEFRGGAPVWLASRLYAELREPDAVSPLAVEGLALELVSRAARDTAGERTRRSPPWLRRAEEFLAARFRHSLTLAELAGAVDVHPVHLATVFRRYLHCTPGEYIRRRRIEYACGQLVRTAAPLAEIALNAGFCHQSHFCRVFKAVTGMTPGAYRRLCTRRV